MIKSRWLRSERWERIKEWVYVTGIAGIGQLAIQVTAFLCGLVVLRSLPAHEYAFYTIANTIIITLNVLTDAGVNSGLLAEGGRAWRDPRRLGGVVATGRALRFRFGLAAAALLLPWGVYVLHHHAAPTWEIAALLLLLLVNFALTANTSIVGVVTSLHQLVSAGQRISVETQLLRLALLFVALRFFPGAAVALAAFAVTQAVVAARFQNLAGHYADLSAPPSAEVRGEVMKNVRRALPAAIYLALSGQINIWLISLLGTTNSVAEVGALARLGQVMVPMTGVAAAVFVPRFARMPDDRGRLFRRYCQVLLLVGLAAAALVTFAALWTTPFQWILRPAYDVARPDIILQMACSGVWMMSGVATSLAAARKCVIPPVVGITCEVAFQAFCIVTLNIGTVRGALWLGTLSGACGLLLQLGNMIHWTRAQTKAAV